MTESLRIRPDGPNRSLHRGRVLPVPNEIGSEPRARRRNRRSRNRDPMALSDGAGCKQATRARSTGNVSAPDRFQAERAHNRMRRFSRSGRDGMYFGSRAVTRAAIARDPGKRSSEVTAQVKLRSQFAEPAMNSTVFMVSIIRVAAAPIWERSSFRLARTRVLR